ncbi:hypothetical protein C8A01DRAFT_48905 [Parachaetomium inaequale]|uniref:Uncharacterized protein n=1 Tax=Parachaetomium inaequale TaxID=2588326 RepID=A0AAN6PEY0_9PEZI|nr:hypothetical protein C8A01DRAFT_48905 [Parachaetomium inaequale]
MERLIRKPTNSGGLSRFGRVGIWLSLWRFVKGCMGLRRTDDAAILTQLVASLKAESEAALQGRIGPVAVTAPWVAAWADDIPVDSDINDALVAAALEPHTREDGDLIYLSETSAVLAANGRQLCKERWCGVDEYELRDLWPPIAYFISLTNGSVYTSFQGARCFYRLSWDNYLGSINTNFGLDKLDQATTPDQFWDALRDHLLSAVAEFTKRQPHYSRSDFIVLTAGEAADRPEFLGVVRSVAEGIPGIRTQHGAAKVPEVELVVSDDPAFSAARGAAFWLRMRMGWSYCDGFEFEDDPVEYGTIGEEAGGHIEL